MPIGRGSSSARGRRGSAAIFAEIDGHLPRPSDWVDGPGGIKPDGRPWAEVAKEYAFVDAWPPFARRSRAPATWSGSTTG